MKVYIGSAIWRDVSARHHKALIPLLRHSDFQYIPSVGDALIERSRGISATHFLRHTDCDIHLSIDSDITDFSLEDTIKMCELAMTHDMVGAMYMTRSPTSTYPTSLLFKGQPMTFNNIHRAEPVKYLATGFTATHRRVFEKLAESQPLCHEKDGARAFYPFYLPYVVDSEEGDPIMLSEDWAFSDRVTEAGFGANIDPAVRVGHMAQMLYRLEDMFFDPVKPHPVVLERLEGTRWRLESAQPSAVQESRQVRRARERTEAKAQA